MSVTYYQLDPFWNDEFKQLEYLHEEFNDTENLARWLALGFANKFTGDMCDMRSQQPQWNNQFIDIYSAKGWKNVGTSYYRMMPGTILPTHSDLYKKYVSVFGLHGKESNIKRAIVFLESWQPGHYAEYCDAPFTNWQAGDTVEWNYDTPHMAANVGSVPRYTLQITGHL